jgi:hypothetical protein
VKAGAHSLTSEVDRSGEIERCRREIEAVEAEIRGGNPDLEGLCLALADWSGELRLLRASGRVAHVRSCGDGLEYRPMLPGIGLSGPKSRTEERKPPGLRRAGWEGELMLLANAVGALASSGLKDSTTYPAFFIAPAMNPRTVCRCHPIDPPACSAVKRN